MGKKTSTPVNPSTGWISAPTAGQSAPVRPSQPVGGGTIATTNAGNTTKKKVKG